MMFNEKFKEVVAHEGAVSIVTWFGENVNISNTWNSYLVIPQDGRVLIPAAGMKKTEANVKNNPKVKMVFASKEVQGLWGKGAGFLTEGDTEFLYEGPEFDMMKQKFASIMNMTRVIAITVNKVTQTV